MTLEDAILEKVRRLPPSEQEKVLRFADTLGGKPKTSRVPARDRSREMRWVAENRSAYVDQWVAVDGDRLVAAGSDALKVYAAAKAKGIAVPFVMHIVPEDPLPFAGW